MWAPETAQKFSGFRIAGQFVEEIRKPMAQCVGSDQFRWWLRCVHRTQPASELLPDGSPVVECQMLEQSLRNAAELDMEMVGAQLSSHLPSVGFACPV